MIFNNKYEQKIYYFNSLINSNYKKYECTKLNAQIFINQYYLELLKLYFIINFFLILIKRLDYFII